MVTLIDKNNKKESPPISRLGTSMPFGAEDVLRPGSVLEIKSINNPKAISFDNFALTAGNGRNFIN